MSITIEGQRQVIEQVARLEAAVKEAGAWRFETGSPLPYFSKIETGRDRYGRVARRAGGAFMARRAYERIGPTIPGQLVAALQREMRGETGAVARTQEVIGRQLTETTAQGTPRVSGRLAGSIYTKLGSRGSARSSR